MSPVLAVRNTASVVCVDPIVSDNFGKDDAQVGVDDFRSALAASACALGVPGIVHSARLTDRAVREGDARKERMQTWNLTPAQAATLSPTGRPSNQ